MARGRTDELKGRPKEAAGALTGDTELEWEGRVEQTAGLTQLGGSHDVVTEGLVTRGALAVRRKEHLRVGLAAARKALELDAGRHLRANAPKATIWDWHLASGRVAWSDTLKDLFGYAERVTDAAWREAHIHPDDRDRVKLSLQRATIVNHGTVWSDQYRFRHADGSYVTVTERAYVVNDDAGPREVLGAITPTSEGRLTPPLIRSLSPTSGPASRARPRG
jgi:PAS domain S-box-containing protein